MPFLGKDWRSSGELWIKTPHGWRKGALLRQKLLENLSQSVLLRFFRMRMSEEHHQELTIPDISKHPQVYLNKLGTRKMISPELDDALAIMEVLTSVHDIRRVQFVLSLTKLLIEKFADLSVQAQKTVVCILGELVTHCERTDMDTPAVRHLVDKLEKVLLSSRFLHIASSQMSVSRSNLLSSYYKRLENIAPSKSASLMSLLDLPDDCLLAVACRFSDPQDILRLGATCKKLQSVCSEPYLWQSVCEMYFTPAEIRRMRSSSTVICKSSLDIQSDWRSQCLRIFRPYRLKRYYADQPLLCQQCWCIFWRLSGHKCPLKSMEVSFAGRDVTPGDFFQLLITG